MNLGWTEILLVGGIALLLFGPSKLPNLGRSLGEAIRGFKKGISDDPQQDARDVSSQISQNTEKPLNQETQEQTVKEKDPNKQS
jgi:sec-independent protein translocase protein TatA